MTFLRAGRQAATAMAGTRCVRRINGNYARNLDVNEVYNPRNDRWQRLSPLPTARSGIAAAALQGRIFVVGGEAPSGTFHHVEAYEPKSDRWTSYARMPTPRHGLGTAVHAGRIYVISGGPTPGASYSSANEIFTPQGKPRQPTQLREPGWLQRQLQDGD